MQDISCLFDWRELKAHYIHTTRLLKWVYQYSYIHYIYFYIHILTHTRFYSLNWILFISLFHDEVGFLHYSMKAKTLTAKHLHIFVCTFIFFLHFSVKLIEGSIVRVSMKRINAKHIFPSFYFLYIQYQRNFVNYNTCTNRNDFDGDVVSFSVRWLLRNWKTFVECCCGNAERFTTYKLELKIVSYCHFFGERYRWSKRGLALHYASYYKMNDCI
jgi:hypothetical protein